MRPFNPLLAVVLCFTLAGKAFSASYRRVVVKDQTAWISWTALPRAPENSDPWAKFCKRLGRRLLSSPGPGFLSSYQCGPANSPPKALPPWHINFTEQTSSIQVRVSFHMDSAAEETEVFTSTFQTNGPQTANLRSEILALALSRLLMENLPLGRAYRYDERAFILPTPEELLVAADEMFLYDLYFDQDEKVWLPKIFARLSKGSEQEKSEMGQEYKLEAYRPIRKRKVLWLRALATEERNEKYQSLISDVLQGRERQAVARIQASKAKADGKSQQDSSKLTPKTKSNALVAKDFLSDLLLGGFRSSYAGFRYGTSVIKSNSVVTDASLLSILAEIGGGPLSGLRWYYDLFPEVKRGSGESEEYFKLSRASLGWAINFAAPEFMNPYITKFDLQPKLGLLDLKSRFAVTTPTGKSGRIFNVKNKADLAIEGGMETSANWYRARLWSAFSTAHLGISGKSIVKVKSSRGGMDLYFDLWESSVWDVNFLAFGTLEHLEISRDIKPVDENEVVLSGVASTLYILGFGFTISW